MFNKFLGAAAAVLLAIIPSTAPQAQDDDILKNLITDVVVYPFTTDDDDWFLISKPQAPVGLALASDPTARISMTTDGLFSWNETTQVWRLEEPAARRRTRDSGVRDSIRV